MIYLIKGDDDVAINAFISQQKKLFARENIFDLGSSFEKSFAENLINTDSLFSENKLVIIFPKKKEQLEFEDSFLETLFDSKLITLLAIPKGLNANLGVLKSFAKHSEVKNFENARDYTFFNFCDALLGEKNKHKSVELLNSIEDLDEAAIPLVSTLVMSLRNFISIKTNNKLSQTLHPFIKGKISKYNLTLSEAQLLYSKLLDLDIAFKTSSVDKKTKFLDLIIYL